MVCVVPGSRPSNSMLDVLRIRKVDDDLKMSEKRGCRGLPGGVFLSPATERMPHGDGLSSTGSGPGGQICVGPSARLLVSGLFADHVDDPGPGYGLARYQTLGTAPQDSHLFLPGETFTPRFPSFGGGGKSSARDFRALPWSANIAFFCLSRRLLSLWSYLSHTTDGRKPQAVS
ncbi:hypothetical protein AXG93_969s1040 [Marchantia polymorpha subsp. ruderalis]|uniref:Uncharacterized protein n=1 Tax=Marchantia polymorpha subsp. ruderalis TaxID=1480154 RepID=A0A176W9X8_MARPO|nr:hypothetical protein AXG93_969s1040 [Marchantia polymorpha subsp. ruderalis]